MFTTRIIETEGISEAVDLVSKHMFNGSREATAAHFHMHPQGESTTLLGFEDDRLVALLTIRWKSRYPPFREAGIPLIQHIEIRYEDRGKGYGTRIMDAAERLIRKRGDKAGICVGISREFGIAMQMYVKRGYIPDGRGALLNFDEISAGQSIGDASHVCLWMVKELDRPSGAGA